MKTNENKTSPVAWVPTLYFAMGLPFVALSMVSVLMFSDLNISNTQIAFWTSLIMLPWTLKPLWSPILEIFKTKKFFVITRQKDQSTIGEHFRQIIERTLPTDELSLLLIVQFGHVNPVGRNVMSCTTKRNHPHQRNGIGEEAR